MRSSRGGPNTPRAIAAWHSWPGGSARPSGGVTWSVHTPSGEVRGIARDLAEDGALVVESAPGKLVRVIAGDVEFGAKPSWIPTA